MVQKLRTIMNDHVTVSHQIHPVRLIFIQKTDVELTVTICDKGDMKMLFDEFCQSFNDNIDFETAIKYFNPLNNKVKF